MEDELEDRVLYQTYVSHLRLMSRVALPVNTGGVWRLLLKPEVLVLSALLFFVVVYIQAVDVWSRGVLQRLQYGASRAKASSFLVASASGPGEKLSWELREGNVAAYAVQGRRPRMEDRFVVLKDINNTGVSLFAVFDGHGGEFAANYARDKLIHNLNEKVAGLKRLLAEGRSSSSSGRPPPPAPLEGGEKPQQKTSTDSPNVERKKSFRKTASSSTDECKKAVTDPELLRRLDSLQRPITREVKPSKAAVPLPATPLEDYLKAGGGGVDYGRLITDEVLAADHLLVEAAKKSMDVAGTTALIALLEGSHLVVANVGDSRGVMCDSKGNAIPLSFDHKPQQVRERKRIKEAGGFVTFNGVWRVAGILATSRALGDYPLKDKRLVIADPDVLTFDLRDHRPQFLLLASDGLWDTFANEEAVAFVRERLDEPHHGAKSVTLQSYYRGSLDNITVLVVDLRAAKWTS